MTPLFPKAGSPFLKILSPDSTGTDAAASVLVFGFDFKLWYIALRWMVTVGRLSPARRHNAANSPGLYANSYPCSARADTIRPYGGDCNISLNYNLNDKSPGGYPRAFSDHRECPLLRMTAMTLSTMVSQVSLLSASTMTRIRGSVPDSRTRIRPESPRAAAASATAFCTSGSF